MAFAVLRNAADGEERLLEALSVWEIGWFGVSVGVWGWWFYRTGGGKRVWTGVPRRCHRVGMGEVLIAAGLYMVTTVLASIPLGGETEPDWAQRDWSNLAMGGGAVLSVLVMVNLLRRRCAGGLKGAGLRPGPGGRLVGVALWYSFVVFGLTFLTLTVTILICQSLGYETVQMHETLKLLEERPPWHSIILLVALPVVVAPLFEELMFRGILQNFFIRLLAERGGQAGRGENAVVGEEGHLPAEQTGRSETTVSDYPEGGQERGEVEQAGQAVRLKEGEGKATEPVGASKRGAGWCRWGGILLTSLTFMLFHENWQHWPALVVLSLGLGYGYERTGSLWVAILMHAFFNLMNVGMLLVKLGTGNG